MSRRRPSVTLTAPLLSVLHDRARVADELETRVLDATEALLRSSGLRRWSVDDVADRARIGRTSVYRRFGGRDELVHAVLTRELRATFDAIGHAAAAAPDPETKVVAAVDAALAALGTSLVDDLLRSDPATFLPYLTTEAGPLLAIARDTIIRLVSAVADPPSPELAETVARIGLSFVLTRDTVLPVDDPEALDAAVRRTVGPLLAALGVTT